MKFPFIEKIKTFWKRFIHLFEFDFPEFKITDDDVQETLGNLDSLIKGNNKTKISHT